MPTTASRMAATAGRVLVAQQVPAQARLGALGVLELDDPRPLDRLLAHAEQARGHLGDHVVGVGDEALGVAALAGAGEAVEGLGHAGLAQQHADVGRAERHAAAVPGHVDGDLRPRIVAAVEHAASVEMSSRRRSAGARRRIAEPQPVEAAARAARFAAPGAARRPARLGHLPGARPSGRASSGNRPASRRPGCRTATGPVAGRRRRNSGRSSAQSGPMQR